MSRSPVIAMHQHSMTSMWLPTHGQTWLEAAASFIAMWTPMMAVMMAPAIAPTLWRYRRAVVDLRGVRAAMLTSIAAAGYLFVWAAFGLAAFPIGAAFATLELRAPAAVRAGPFIAGVVVVLAGVLQFTAWKERNLHCCRQASGDDMASRATVASAWRYGLGLGVRCSYCCIGLTAILLVIGVMNMYVMTLVTIAIAAERLASRGVRVAHGVGFIAVLTGLGLIASASVELVAN